MPCSSTWLKSKLADDRRGSARRTREQTARARASTGRRPADWAISPIVVGSLRSRTLRKLNPAASTVRIASKSNRRISLPLRLVFRPGWSLHPASGARSSYSTHPPSSSILDPGCRPSARTGQGRSNRNQESAASTTGGDHERAGGRVGGGIPLDPTQADGDRSPLRRTRRLRAGIPQRGAGERRPVHRHLQRAERRLCRRRVRSPQGCGGLRDDLRRGRAERAQRPGGRVRRAGAGGRDHGSSVDGLLQHPRPAAPHPRRLPDPAEDLLSRHSGLGTPRDRGIRAGRDRPRAHGVPGTPAARLPGVAGRRRADAVPGAGPLPSSERAGQRRADASGGARGSLGHAECRRQAGGHRRRGADPLRAAGRVRRLPREDRPAVRHHDAGQDRAR